jgi:hypothetical protein
MFKTAFKILVVLSVCVMLFPIAGSLAHDLGSDVVWPTVPASLMILATIVAGFYALAMLVSCRHQ